MNHVCTQCHQPYTSSRGGEFCDRCTRARAAENRRRRYMGLPPLPRAQAAGEITPRAVRPVKRGVWRVEGEHWGRESKLQAAELRQLERDGGLEPGDRAIDPEGRVYVWRTDGLMPERGAG